MRRTEHPVRAIVVAITIVFSLAAAAPADLEKAQRLVNEALQLLQEQEPRDALERLEEAIAEEPEFAPAHYYTGMAFGQLQRHGDALEAFIRAGELDPGNGEAYRMATMSAYHARRFDDCWEQAILAAQAGVDMSQAFQELRNAAPPPDDIEARLAAPRVVVAEVDVSRLAAGDAAPTLMPGGGSTAPTAESATAEGTEVTSVFDSRVITGSSTILAQSQADLVQARRQLAFSLARSRSFAVVKSAESAGYVVQIEVDAIDRNGRMLQGYLRVRDAESGEIEYSREIELSNITSVSDLRIEFDRYVEYLERWAHGLLE